MHVTINNANLFCVDSGNPSGMPVIFVHGFPFSHEMWKPQLDLVGRTYRAIAYDVRGHGSSDIGDGQYSVESHVDDLLGLLDHLKIRKTVIVGLSMGGYITLRALEREAGRFIAAVLCDTRSEADTNEAKIGRFGSIAAIKKGGSAPFAESFAKRLFAPESFTNKLDQVGFIQKIMTRTPPLSLAGTLLALASRTDTTSSLKNITIPVLILVGEHDPITPPSAAEAMHALIPGSELHIVPGAAHMSNLENPDFFNQKLLAFLKRVQTLPR